MAYLSAWKSTLIRLCSAASKSDTSDLSIISEWLSMSELE